jgi:hypothetical protein
MDDNFLDHFEASDFLILYPREECERVPMTMAGMFFAGVGHCALFRQIARYPLAGADFHLIEDAEDAKAALVKRQKSKHKKAVLEEMPFYKKIALGVTAMHIYLVYRMRPQNLSILNGKRVWCHDLPRLRA